MSNITVSVDYRASADKVWDVIGQPGSISSWHPAVATSKTEGNSRTCTLADGAEIKESILHHDDSRREYRYSIISSPLPIKDYVSTLKVTSEESGCRVTWTSDFEVVGAPVPDIEAAIQGLYEAGLNQLSQSLA